MLREPPPLLPRAAGPAACMGAVCSAAECLCSDDPPLPGSASAVTRSGLLAADTLGEPPPPPMPNPAHWPLPEPPDGGPAELTDELLDVFTGGGRCRKLLEAAGGGRGTTAACDGCLLAAGGCVSDVLPLVALLCRLALLLPPLCRLACCWGLGARCPRPAGWGALAREV
jgi:hypothetical protein